MIYSFMPRLLSFIGKMIIVNCVFILFVVTVNSAPSTTDTLQWSHAEINQLKQLSLKNLPQLNSDPSNKYLHDPEAIKFGKDLFNDKRMSTNLSVACASCHIQEKAFTDKRNIALGIRIGVRNTPSLLNVAQQNWFFWDGRKDSLWSQALGPLENPAEHAFSRLQMIHFIANDATYRKRYEQIFPQKLPSSKVLSELPAKGSPNGNIEELISWKKLPKETKKRVNRVFSNIGKAIAAYVFTIKSKPTQFDRFVDALQHTGHSPVMDKAAQRGLKLFIGRANCANCHSGALFSNKEFHNIGTGILGKDNGRSEIINEVKYDVFNCLGEFSDATPEQCMELKYMGTDSHALAGAYRTPSLRGVAKTAPYMHDGRFKSLQEVLNYYAGIDKEKAMQTDLPPMSLSAQDQADIIRFLQTL